MIAFVIVASVFGFYFYKFPDALNNQKADLGTLGDFVGGILNPLLSFLALIILLRTFSMQREELVIQREELKDTKEILKTQSQTQIKQQFESTFFALLNVYNQILADLSYEPPPPNQNDGTRFGHLLATNKTASKLQNISFAVFVRDSSDMISNERFFWLKQCKEKLQKQNNLCGHYFRILYQILKFIENNAPTENEKMYSNIVRALLTDDVMQLLAVNCYCENEQDTYWQYKLLIERYALFEHASFDNKDGDNHPVFSEIRNFYDDKAFGL